MTATVESIPLIASSVMSKKLAAGAGSIVLDVKAGRGAFMKRVEDAYALAETMVAIGQGAAGAVSAVISSMEQPLGNAVGNALEVREAVQTLRGEGPADFAELALDASAHLLALSDLGVDRAEARRRTEAAVADGSAYAMYGRWVRAQGGDPDESALPEAPFVREVFAPQAGYVHALGALAVGLAALHLGAGRREKDDPVDHAVGVVCVKKRGDSVEAGEPLAEIHAQDESSADEAAKDVLAAYELADEPPRARSIVLRARDVLVDLEPVLQRVHARRGPDHRAGRVAGVRGHPRPAGVHGLDDAVDLVHGPRRDGRVAARTGAASRGPRRRPAGRSPPRRAHRRQQPWTDRPGSRPDGMIQVPAART